MRRDILLILILGVIVSACSLNGSYGLRVLTLAGVYALSTIGFHIVFGLAGALSLAHGAFFGVGAYTTGILSTRYGLPFEITFLLSMLIPALLAVVIAAPTVRLESHYFSLATLAIAQALLIAAVHGEEITGGANGLAGIPGLNIFGRHIERGWPHVTLVWSLVAIGGAIAWKIGDSLYGCGQRISRDHPMVAKSLGLNLGRMRMEALIISATYAGAAGALTAHLHRVVSPEVLEFPVMVSALTMTVTGGRQRVLGAIAGALILVPLPEVLRDLGRGYLIVYGAALLFSVLLLPNGLAGRRRPPHRTQKASASPLPFFLTGGTLTLSRVEKRFGGVIALDDVSCIFPPGVVTGLIGANGSGKTTLINVITGMERPDSGNIRLDNQTLSSLPPEQIARSGIARTFQTVAISADDTVLEAVIAARAAGRDRSMARAQIIARSCLALLYLEGVAEQRCGDLSPGILRRVEIARALACEPRVLLLDEPSVGLTDTEQEALANRLRALAATGLTILAVDHSMSFLWKAVDRIACMENGHIIAEGSPNEIQCNPQVRAAYLGNNFSSI
ncbi:branched-chain amino acid transport system ATP-binding protein [Azospirillaceae bacterium]